jgi:uncharacterized membrane protein
MLDLIENLSFAIHGVAGGGGLAESLENILLSLERLLNLSAAELLPTLLPGLVAMDNLHPLFVHFPIVLISIFCFLELFASFLNKIAWRKTANGFLYSACIFSGLTVLAGWLAAAHVEHSAEVHEIMETHEHLGIGIFCLTVFLSIWRKVQAYTVNGFSQYLFLGCVAILFGLVIFAADLGGLMVYKHGVGVAHLNGGVLGEESGEQAHEHHHDH